jgi:nicotinate dehydrogenase subunit B
MAESQIGFSILDEASCAFALRGDLAKVLGMQTDEVDVVHVPGAGCYGHNGADDVALDAALVALAILDVPIKLQGMRDDEFAWAPFGPGLAMKVEAALGSDGKIVDWSYDVWSNSHAMRPGQPGGVNFLAAWDLKTPFVKSPAPHIPQPFGDGDRNAVPSYELPRKDIRNHLLLDAPVRNGWFRTLGSHGNIFAIESFVDELAQAAGSDPVGFRLAHLRDPRAQAVLQAAADRAGWAAGKKGDGQHGRGLAFCRYKSIGMYAAGGRRRGRPQERRHQGAPRGDGGRPRTRRQSGRREEPARRRYCPSAQYFAEGAGHLRQTGNHERDWSGYSVLTFPEVPSVEIV